MITETITTIKLTASEGMMLTDGENYGKEVYLAEDAEKSLWYEITEDEYEKLVEDVEDAPHEEEIIENVEVSADDNTDN